MEQTFGSYVREKRMARGLSLRGLAAQLEVSPVYMSNMENDRRPAPTKEKLDRLIEILGLCQADTELLLDLAAKSKTQRVSADLPEYIMERDIVRAALRTAKEVDATDEEWQECIDRITQRGKRDEGKGRQAHAEVLYRADDGEHRPACAGCLR